MMKETEPLELTVNLGSRSYPISIGLQQEQNLLAVSAMLSDEGRKHVAVIDQGLLEKNPSFMQGLLKSLPVIEIPSGETSKSVVYLEKIWNFLAAENVDRTGVLFALGGGVTGDLAGFAAASYLRGIEFVQIPTTLLAMVDSSVGGKTGINLKAGKNLVGSFHQPNHVFVDLEVLDSLSKREFSSGVAEIIKYGMLGNQQLFAELLSLDAPLNPKSEELSQIVFRCCLEKAKIVEQDEREINKGEGGRALLNLGHTFAHAFESVAGYGKYLHGEAVSIGLLCAFRLSKKLNLCQKDSETALMDLLESYDLPTKLNASLRVDDLIKAMQNDKKVMRGNLRFVLMEEIGKSFVHSSVDSTLVRDVLCSIGAS